MNEQPYAVKWGKRARTIIYTDKEGEITFTFDFPEDPDPMGILLEHGFVQGDPSRYALAVERTRAFLTSEGRNIHN